MFNRDTIVLISFIGFEENKSIIKEKYTGKG